MRIDEAFRRVVGGYWWLIGLLVLLPVIAAASYGSHQAPRYQAVARLQMSGGLASTNVQADAATQWLQGVVTSPNLVQKAMVAGGLTGDPTAFALESVAVNRIGVSTVNEVSVVTDSPDRSVVVASSLVDQAMSMANGTRESDATKMDALNKEIAQVTASRDALIKELATAKPGPVLSLQARIASMEPILADLLRQRSDLALASSSRSSIGLIDQARALPDPVGIGVPQMVALAALAGLLLGLGVAALLEAVRPRVRGRSWVAAELGAPLLGHLPTTDLTSRAAARAVSEFGASLAMIARRFRGQSLLLLPVEPRDRAWCGRAAEELSTLTGIQIDHRLSDAPEIVGLHGADSEEESPVVVALARTVVSQRRLEDFAARSAAMGWPVVGVLTFRRRWSNRVSIRWPVTTRDTAAAGKGSGSRDSATLNAPTHASDSLETGAITRPKARRIP
ncbi:hypothetical protein N865_07690 [Intrasporangium oryzae NRRL B-24470]|uniref:Polysaccharide chain length determinant N-terminal domain-containing protein n=1 Tax=Intrasporangium oryzae NRRL B-24470 TaxID=1386089 RepID=W9GA92_9MICO|nr:hypothetical protein [Intrasporangium oryzae]EWT01758.1 hypothetical protein N865_07690 [Intrasporangium oryzae NRRL B-24470]